MPDGFELAAHGTDTITAAAEAKILAAKVAGIQEFATWLRDAYANWPEDIRRADAIIPYVAGTMARQYANWLEGKDPDADRTGWPRLSDIVDLDGQREETADADRG